MAKHIIPFDQATNLPANLAALNDDEDWGSGQVGGFPVISIKSKVFHICRGEDKELVARPDDPDEPAGHISVVVIKTHKGVARTFYASNYEEGSAEKPDCYSNDGIRPAADAENPQCKTCALCPQSQWGSRTTESGKKGKACSEVKRLAVAAPGQLNDPMLLRVPPTSLRNWDQYVDMLKKRGATPPQVVTKISFDHSVSHQLLNFKPIGFIDGPLVEQLLEVRDSELVQNITGQGPGSGYAGDPSDDSAGGPAPEKAEPPKKTKAKPAPEPDEGEEEEEDEPPKKTTRRTRKPAPEPEVDEEEEDEPPKKATRKTKAKPAPEPEPEEEEEEPDDDLDADLEEALSSLGLDDD